MNVDINALCGTQAGFILPGDTIMPTSDAQIISIYETEIELLGKLISMIYARSEVMDNGDEFISSPEDTSDIETLTQMKSDRIAHVTALKQIMRELG